MESCDIREKSLSEMRILDNLIIKPREKEQSTQNLRKLKDKQPKM